MALFAAMILDALLGEPAALWRRVPHPAILIGRLIGGLDARFNRGGRRRLRGAGALAVVILVAGGVGASIASLPFGAAFEAIGAAVLLAQRSLVDHVRAVAAGLDRGVADGRAEVAKIVGRDVTPLSRAGVARAAIESGAENASDGVVAPAFWFLAAGLPGMAIYKAVNTADSMIGHRTERHREFGWAAARLDDVLNFAPARLTAALIAVSHLSRAALSVAYRDARLHRSPNAGWPEAATAAIIGVALSGPRVYQGAPNEEPFVYAEGRRDAGPADIRAAVGVLWRLWGALLVIVALAALA